MVGGRARSSACLPRCSHDVSCSRLIVHVFRAQMLKGGVIMDVVNPEQARIAEEAGAVAVMALERVPADIRADGGVARMSDPGMIKEIMAAVTIPVMAKVRIGHFVEAQIIEAVGVDYIDESEVLTPADEELHINKHKFKVREPQPGRLRPFRLSAQQSAPPHASRVPGTLAGAICLRVSQPGRGTAPHRRGRLDDPHQGRGGHRQCGRGCPPRTRRAPRDQAALRDGRGRALHVRCDLTRPLLSAPSVTTRRDSTCALQNAC